MKTSVPKYKEDSRTGVWLKRIGIAALVSILVHLTIMYIDHGNFTGIISLPSGLELTFTFLYFLSLFWVYPKISEIIHSSALIKISGNVLNFLEGFLVVLSTLLLTGLTKIFPLWLLLLILNNVLENFNGRFDLEAVRHSLVIHAFLGLFFYYFVERERLRKKIRAEHLRFAQLQRKEFKNQLENLKNRVNPDFLFRSLDTLDSLIEENPEKAVEFVGNLSFVYRSFLNTKEQLIELKQELDLARAYIAILKMQFGNTLRFSINTEPESLSLYLPPGTLQMLIENAVPETKNLQSENPLHIEISTTRRNLVVKSNRNNIPGKDYLQKNIDLIRERYRFLSNEPVEVEETHLHYEVEIPLLQLKQEVKK
jgi:sensor histidine kinase YesM